MKPDAATREHLLGVLAELVARGGAERLLAPPVEPTADAFPEPYQPTRAGVAAVLRRLLWHAGIDRAVETDDQRHGAPPTERKPETRIAVTRVGRREASFVVNFIGADDVVGTLAHEVGVVHAVLARSDDASPYRAAEVSMIAGGDGRDREVDPDRDLARGSIAAVYVGLGVVAANAAYQQYSQAGRFNGAYVPLEYEVIRAGYLPMSSLAYLLAVQAVVRGEREPVGLSGPQRDEVTAWLDALAGDRAALRARLGIATDAKPAARPAVVPFDDVEPLDDPAPAKTGFRWRTHRGFAGLIVGTVLGGGAALALAHPNATPFLVFGGAAAGHVAGRRIRVPRCTACASVIAPDATQCRHCGAELRGDIARLSDRLDAEERLEVDRE